MLRWFDELAAQGIFTTDTGAGRPQLEPLARAAHRACAADDVDRAAALRGRVPISSRAASTRTYRAALAGEPRVLAHRFHRYLIPGRPGARAGAERAHRAARGRRRGRRHDHRHRRRERARRERARAAQPDRDRRSGARASPKKRSASRTSSSPRCRTRSARRSTPCSAGRRSCSAARSSRRC